METQSSSLFVSSDMAVLFIDSHTVARCPMHISRLCTPSPTLSQCFRYTMQPSNNPNSTGFGLNFVSFFLQYITITSHLVLQFISFVALFPLAINLASSSCLYSILPCRSNKVVCRGPSALKSPGFQCFFYVIASFDLPPFTHLIPTTGVCLLARFPEFIFITYFASSCIFYSTTLLQARNSAEDLCPLLPMPAQHPPAQCRMTFQLWVF